MKTHLRHSCFAGLALMLLVPTPDTANAQAEALSGLLDNATDFNFSWTEVGVPRGTLRPDRGSSASGAGFELTFEIPVGLGKRKLRAPKPISLAAPIRGRAAPLSMRDTTKNCAENFRAGRLRDGEKCSDTTYTHIKLTRTKRDTTYEEKREIEEFDWEPPLVTFEVAVGFTQAGPFIPRESTEEMRVSVREAPAVSLYGNFPLAGRRLAGYFGARTGLVQLAGGRGYTTDGVPITLDGSTFQVGGVLGTVLEIAGLNFFAEGAYMFRHIGSLEWGGDLPVGSLPRSANLGGPSVAFGVQFQFKDTDEE